MDGMLKKKKITFVETCHVEYLKVTNYKGCWNKTPTASKEGVRKKCNYKTGRHKYTLLLKNVQRQLTNRARTRV